MINKNSKHDSLVDLIEARFKSNGWKTYTYTEYHNHHGDGEIDLYCTKDGYRAVVEVKCNIANKNWLYAHNQLARAVKCYFHNDKTRTFPLVAYYTSKDYSTYNIEWVNPNKPKPLF